MRLPWNQWLVGASEMVGRAVVGIPVGTLVGCGLGPGVGGPAELVSYEYEPWSFAPEGGAVVGEALEKVGTPLGSGVVVGAGLLVGEALASTVGDELGAAVAIVGDAVSVGEALEKVGEALEKVGTPLGSG